MEALHHGLRHIISGNFPGLNDLIITLLVRVETVTEGSVDAVHLFLRGGNELRLLFRNRHIVHRNGERRTGRIFIAHFLDVVQHFGALCGAVMLDAVVNEHTQDLLDIAFFRFEEGCINFHLERVFGLGTIHKAKVLRNIAVEDHTTVRGIHQTGNGFAVHLTGNAHTDGRMETENAGFIGHGGLVKIAESHAFAGLAGLFHQQIVGAKDHILRRHGNSAAVNRLEQVVGREHQKTRLGLCLSRKRHMNRHLVTVKVGVESSADQRVKFDGTTVHQHRLKCLNRQTVQGRRTVQKHRMFLDDIFKGIPDFRMLIGTLDFLLCLFDIGGLHHFGQALDNKRLEKLQRHFTRQTALIDLQIRTDDNHRTAGIVHALTQQVLAEAALLAAQHFGKRLELAVGRTGNGLATATVVNQGIHGLLQHPLFVADHNVGRVNLHQFFEAVVAGNDPAIKLIKVRRSETTAVQLRHGADIRRQNRQDIQNHPVKMIARFAESLDYFQALDNAHPLLTGRGEKLVFQLKSQRLDINSRQQFLNGFRAHTDAELVAIHFTVFFIGLFAQNRALHQWRHAGIQHHILGKVEHLLQLLRRDVQHQRHPGRYGLEVPDVRNRAGQFDVTHPFAAHFFGGDLHAAFFTLVHPSLRQGADMGVFVFSAHAGAVLGRPENPLAEKSADFGLQGTVVDGFGLGHFTVRPITDHLGRGQTDLDRIKFLICHVSFLSFYQFSSSKSVSSLSSGGAKSESSSSSSSASPSSFSTVRLERSSPSRP